MKQILILCLAALVVALPFIFRPKPEEGGWLGDDPELVLITPHNEALRREFEVGFSHWHRLRYGRPVRFDWRVIGGTTEIMRYLTAEYEASLKRFQKSVSQREGLKRETGELAACGDDPAAVTCGIDLFFGGGVYDHAKAERQGLTVPAWPSGAEPAGLFKDNDGRILIPREMNGEVWRGKAYYGSVLSAFGICYNADRLRDLGIRQPPAAWEDLADPRYVGTLGLADPTKSGSVAKAFEMILHAQCVRSVVAAGFTRGQIRQYEAAWATSGSAQDAKPPEGVPAAYPEAIGCGWREGVNLVRRLGANARYFTDASGKVPSDVAMGAAAAGIVIDFYGRLQEELSARPDGRPVMTYVTPVGGSSMTADPISLLRGAPHRMLAVRFIEYLLGESGQRLWNYRVGTPGGPKRFALRRLPIRRDFYPSSDPVLQAAFEQHRPFLADALWRPDADAYRLSEAFPYEARWTASHFGVQRDLIRAMCIDSGEELRRAWRAILRQGGPERQPEAMRLLEALPEHPFPLSWATAVKGYSAYPRLDLLRQWTAFFREQYRQAEKVANSAADAYGGR